MAMYYCFECDRFVDNDYHPGEPDPQDDTQLICPDCAEKETLAIAGWIQKAAFSPDQLAKIRKMEAEDEE